MISTPYNLLRETFEEVCRKTRSKHTLSRLESAWQLGELYPHQEQVLSLLPSLLQDPDEDVRGTAAEALGKVGALQRGTIPILVEMLRRKDETDFNARVAYALGRSGKSASAATARLIAAINDVDSHASWAAVWALGEIGNPSPEVLEVLRRVIEEREASHRLVALWALQRIGRAAMSIIPQVKSCVFDPHPIVRLQASRTLEEIDSTWRAVDRGDSLFTNSSRSDIPHGQSEVQCTGVDDVEWGVEDIDEVGEIGSAGGIHIPKLVELLHHQVPDIQGAAAEALGKVGHGSLVAPAELCATLGQKDCPVRARIAWALGWTGSEESKVVEQLVGLMEELGGISHSEIEARWAALWSFGQIAKADERKVEILVSMLSDAESDLRFLAAECLGNIPAHAKPAVPGLLQAAHDLHSTVRNRALWALSKIEALSLE